MKYATHPDPYDDPLAPRAGGAGTSSDSELDPGDTAEVVARLEMRRRARRMLAVALLAVVVVLGWSLGTALVRGSDPLSVKFVEWVRGHGGGGIVNAIERTWYEHHQPSKGGTPKGGIPKVAAPIGPHVARHRNRAHAHDGSVFAPADATDRESCARG